MPKIKHYLTKGNSNPYIMSLKGIRDPVAKAKIASRATRAATGNYGDHKPCRESVWEMRIDQGIGYRVYYAEVEDPVDGTITLILLAGDKPNQTADIKTAITYLIDYKNR